MSTIVHNNLAKLFLLVLPSVFIYYLSLFLCLYIWYGYGLGYEEIRLHYEIFTGIYLFWVLVLYSYNLFDFRVLKRIGDVFRLVFWSSFLNLLVAVFYLYFQSDLLITPRRFLLVNLFFSSSFLFCWLVFVRWLLQKVLIEELFILETSEYKSLFSKDLSLPLGYSVLRRINIGELQAISDGFSGAIVLPYGLLKDVKLWEDLYRIKRNGVYLYNDKWFYEKVFRKIHPKYLTYAWFLENVRYKDPWFYIVIKRYIDLLVGSLCFFVFIFSYPLFAALIKFYDGGDVIFKQERVGLWGKSFFIYKYRTMKMGSSRGWTRVNDDRITPIGKWLRKTRLDELPQCINLIKGEMSLVGPRPEQKEIAQHLSTQVDFYDERHMVKPGLTGWAQLHVYAGNLDETKEKLHYDLYYILNRSLLFDLEIVLKTTYHVLSGKGQ